MGDPQLQVVTDQLRTHATKIQEFMGTLTNAVEASAYLGNADDGFGWLARSLANHLLQENSRDTVEVISKAAGETAEIPDKLGTVAEKFDEWDQTWARKLQDFA